MGVAAKRLESIPTPDYAVEIVRDEFGYFARIPDLPGCESHGESVAEAFASIEEAKESWIQAVTESGGSVPLPRGEDDYSGRFVVRVGASIHRDLVRLAALDGVSLNAFVTAVLARETGRRQGR